MRPHKLKQQIRWYTFVVPSKTIPDSRPNWAKYITLFRPKRRIYLFLWRSTLPPPPLPSVIYLPPRPQSVMGKKVPIWLLHRRRWAQQQAMYPKKYLHGHAVIICDMWKKKFLFLKLWEKERRPNVMIWSKVNNIDITTVAIRDKSFENCTWREYLLNLLKLLAGLGFLLFFLFHKLE